MNYIYYFMKNRSKTFKALKNLKAIIICKVDITVLLWLVGVQL